MPGPADLSIVEARRLAIAAQGLAAARPSVPTRRHVAAAIDRLGVLQLDAINVVQRTQHLVLFSRLGAVDPAHLHSLTGPRAELFEYWGHMASLQPAVQQPLFRWRMEQVNPYGDSPARQAAWERWLAEHGGYMDEVLAEVADRGPLRAGELTDPRRRDGDWWERRGVGRQALEWLFFRGRLSGWRTPAFERVYDLPERALPPEVLAAPTPSADAAQRELLVVAAGALGVGTAADLADYHRIGTRTATPRIQELVAEGRLVEVRVEGWRDPAYLRPDAAPVRLRRSHATLLSPFDSLIWFRARAARLFGYDFRIEVYTPAPKRVYGYYVLSVLLGTDIVARLDVKADRAGGRLLVHAAHLEPGRDAAVVAGPVAAELAELGRWLGLDRIAVADRGDLAPALRRATA